MSETLTISGKEIRTLIRSRRFTLGFLLIVSFTIVGAYQSFLTYQKQIELFGRGEIAKPTPINVFASSVWIVSNSLLPLISILLGSDAIVRERRTGTIRLMLARSVSKVSIVIGKFFGIFTMVAIVSFSSIMIASGLTISLIGPFSIEEITRIMAFLMMLLIYISIWISISILLSSITNSPVSSFFISFILLVSFSSWCTTSVALQNMLAPLPFTWIGGDPYFDAISEFRNKIAFYINWISPSAVFVEGSCALLNPMIDVPPFESQFLQRASPLDIVRTLKNVWPCISAMVCMLVVTLATSYLMLRVQGTEIEGKA